MNVTDYSERKKVSLQQCEAAYFEGVIVVTGDSNVFRGGWQGVSKAVGPTAFLEPAYISTKENNEKIYF